MIVLAGGKGTRLQDVVSDVPKPLAQVGGRPFLDYVLETIAASGCVRKAVLAIGHLAHKVIEHYEIHGAPIPVEFVVETEPLGTGGAIANALEATQGETVLACNADSLARWDLAGLLTAHRDSDAQVTIGTTEVSDASRFGTCVIEDGKVVRFLEKQGVHTPGTINLGVYAFKRGVITGTGAFSLESSILPALASQRAIQAFPMAGPFLDIGLPETYAAAESFLENLSEQNASGEAN